MTIFIEICHKSNTLLLNNHHCIKFLTILCHSLHPTTHWCNHTSMLPSIFTGYLLRNIMRPIIINVTRIIKLLHLTVALVTFLLSFVSWCLLKYLHMCVCACVCFTLGNNADSRLSSDDVDRDDGPFCSSTNAHYTFFDEVSGHEWQALPLDMDPKSSCATKSTLEQHSVQESSVPHKDAPAAGRLYIRWLDVILFVFSYSCSLSRELSTFTGLLAWARCSQRTFYVSVYSADVDSRCPSPLIGCRRLAAVLLDTSAAAEHCL